MAKKYMQLVLTAAVQQAQDKYFGKHHRINKSKVTQISAAHDSCERRIDGGGGVEKSLGVFFELLPIQFPPSLPVLSARKRARFR